MTGVAFDDAVAFDAAIWFDDVDTDQGARVRIGWLGPVRTLRPLPVRSVRHLGPVRILEPSA